MAGGDPPEEFEMYASPVSYFPLDGTPALRAK
jgi:hypothetical protein